MQCVLHSFIQCSILWEKGQFHAVINLFSKMKKIPPWSDSPPLPHCCDSKYHPGNIKHKTAVERNAYTTIIYSMISCMAHR